MATAEKKGRRPRILVIGGDGLIGSALVRGLPARGVQIEATSRHPGSRLLLDLAHPATWPEFGQFDAAIIVAALARLGDCEREPEQSHLINALAPRLLAERLAGQGTYVLHLSSDKVFDGTLPLRQRDEATCPTTVYGQHKAEAEGAVLKAGGAVLRLSKVLSPRLALLDSWARDLRAGRAITAFSDMWLAPISLGLLVHLIARLLQDRIPGIFQCSGAKDRPYAALAGALAVALGAGADQVSAVATPASLAAASQVRNSTLDMSVERSRYNLGNPDFETVAGEIGAAL